MMSHINGYTQKPASFEQLESLRWFPHLPCSVLALHIIWHVSTAVPYSQLAVPYSFPVLYGFEDG